MGFLCRFYGVSRSGYYVWRDRPESRTAEENRKLLKEIQRVHGRSHGVYGSPRVNKGLRKEGITVSKHRVARLMRENALSGRVVRVTRRQPGLHRFCIGKANQLIEAGAPAGPNHQWSGDITYLKVNQKYRYLAVVIDLYSRKIVGWSLGDRRTVELTMRAMNAAIARRQPEPGLIFHTDRGIEYRSFEYQGLLDRHGIIVSMNRPAQTTDNAMSNRFSIH